MNIAQLESQRQQSFSQEEKRSHPLNLVTHHMRRLSILLIALSTLSSFSMTEAWAAPPQLQRTTIAQLPLAIPMGWTSQVAQNNGVATIVLNPPNQTPRSPSMVILGIPAQLGQNAPQALLNGMLQSTMPDAVAIQHQPMPAPPSGVVYGAHQGTVSGVPARIGWILIQMPNQQVSLLALLAAPTAIFNDWGGAGFLTQVLGIAQPQYIAQPQKPSVTPRAGRGMPGHQTPPGRAAAAGAGGRVRIPVRYRNYNQPIIAYLAETIDRQSPAQVRQLMGYLNQNELMSLSTYSSFANQVGWYACQADPNFSLQLSTRLLNCPSIMQSWASSRSFAPQLTPQNCDQCKRQALDISMAYRATTGQISRAEFQQYMRFRQNENNMNSRSMQRIITNIGSSVCVCGDPGCDC